MCLMRENNDHWFSCQAHMFDLPFTIFIVHKIKEKCNVLFKIKLNCKNLIFKKSTGVFSPEM